MKEIKKPRKLGMGWFNPYGEEDVGDRLCEVIDVVNKLMVKIEELESKIGKENL